MTKQEMEHLREQAAMGKLTESELLTLARTAAWDGWYMLNGITFGKNYSRDEARDHLTFADAMLQALSNLERGHATPV